VDRSEALARLRSARVACLATVRPDGRPHAVPFVFALTEAGERTTVYWAVDRKPKRSQDLQRLRNLAVNPAAEILVHGYDDRWERLWWVRASGTSRRAADPGEPDLALAALREKYPQYADDPPDGPVIAIEVADLSGWEAAPD
jgi:PPOX class probable F420-dependent enzyme